MRRWRCALAAVIHLAPACARDPVVEALIVDAEMAPDAEVARNDAGKARRGKADAAARGRDAAAREVDAAALARAADAAPIERALDATVVGRAGPPDAEAPEEDPVALGPARGPLVIASTEGLDVLSRKAEKLGHIALPGAVVRGVSHDRRTGDGVWVLVAGSPPRIAKLGWDGRRLAAVDLSRPPLRRARRFLGVDHVMGHGPRSDLLLVLYVNRLGVPVIEGLRIHDGSTRFSIGFSKEADVDGVRADGLRHDAVDGLLVLDWWTLRAGQRLERWRFFYGFVDRTDDRALSARLDAFDIPPWREIWGVDRRGQRVLRLDGQGALVETLPVRGTELGAVAIAP